MCKYERHGVNWWAGSIGAGVSSMDCILPNKVVGFKMYMRMCQCELAFSQILFCVVYRAQENYGTLQSGSLVTFQWLPSRHFTLPGIKLHMRGHYQESLWTNFDIPKKISMHKISDIKSLSHEHEYSSITPGCSQRFIKGEQKLQVLGAGIVYGPGRGITFCSLESPYYVSYLWGKFCKFLLDIT